jgi:DNA-binding NarL/FixJ family response regulator
MKVLIVSFDRSLVKRLKDALSEYEVMDVKNGEEALSLATSYFDVIIYDAISGALSEEDINNLYQQKFKDAKFVVLVDDLFPINAQNLKPQKKMLIPRESTLDQILSAVMAPVQETEEYQLPTLELEIETHKQTVGEVDGVIEITPSQQESIQKLFFEEELKLAEAHPESKEEVSQYIPESAHPKKKVAVVSFDSTLVDSITPLLSENFEPVAVRSFRDLESILKDVDGVIFDAISGLAAKKRLMELAKDQDIAQKPFLVLIDELFNINIDDVPLRNKHAISREESPKDIVEKFKEIIVPLKEEETTLMQMLGELLEKQEAVQEKEKDAETEEFLQIIKELEMPKIPIKEAMPTVSASEQKTERLEDVLKGVSLEDIKKVIEETIKEEIKRAFEGFNPSDLVRELLREELKKGIESIPLEGIIKEITYQVLRERLRELIT